MAEKRQLNLSTLKCSVVKFKDGFLNVPVFLLDAFNLLYCGGIKNEGIFRKSGNLARIKNMKYPFFGDFGVPEGTTSFDVCHLIKQFFRELEDPLLTDALEPQFLQFQVMSRETTRIKYVLELCHVLPPRHRETLAYLMRKLNHVAEYSEHNKMDAKNLAIVFAPCIFAKNTPPLELTATNVEQMEKSRKDNDAKVSLVEILIENADQIGSLSEYEKVMSPDMYDKLLPEDRVLDPNSSTGHVRQRKSQTFSSKNDGSTPLTSKTKTSLSKRKSSTDSGILFSSKPAKTDDKTFPVVSKVSHDESVELKSPKKHRSSYSMTMKNLSIMARSEVDMRHMKGATIANDADDQDDVQSAAASTRINSKKYERRNSYFNRRRSAQRSKQTKKNVLKQEYSMEEVLNEVIKKNSGTEEVETNTDEQPKQQVLNEVKPDFDADADVKNLIDDVVSLTVKSLDTNLITCDEASMVVAADDATPVIRELLTRGHSANLNDRITEGRRDSVPRSQSDSTGIGKVSAGQFQPKDRRRVQTSPRKKLKRNVANVKSIRRIVKASSRQVAEEPLPVKIEPAETDRQNDSIGMDFENSDARRELLLQQTENTESAIIDVRPPADAATSASVAQTCESSPAALHRPSVAFIVEKRRGIVRQQTAKFEGMAAQASRSTGNDFISPTKATQTIQSTGYSLRSPSKLMVCNDQLAINQNHDEKPTVNVENLAASGDLDGAKRGKCVSFSPNVSVLQVSPRVEPRRTPRNLPHKSYSDMVNMVENPLFTTPNETSKIKKPLKRLTSDSPNFGKSNKKYPDSPKNPLKTTKKILPSSVCEKI